MALKLSNLVGNLYLKGPFPDGETLGKHPTGQPKCTSAKKNIKVDFESCPYLRMRKFQDTILTEENNKRLMLKVIFF